MLSNKDDHELLTRLFLFKNEWENVLYVHTPFCHQRCTFCVYYSVSTFTDQDFRIFFSKVLPQQIERYKLLLDRLRFRQIYFGGGTPSIASPRTLTALYDLIPNFHQIPIKCTEASPDTITDDHIRLYDKYGFHYVSLGVQSLSKGILKKINRPHVPNWRLREICKALDEKDIICNLDLICYLDTGTAADVPKFADELRYMMAVLKPTSIDVYPSYWTKNTHTKTRLLIDAIRRSLKANPEYRCVNSLLKDEDISLDSKRCADYRLVRKYFEFDSYQHSKIPHLISGSNILSIGHRGNIHTISSVNGYTMKVYEDRITSLIERLPLQYDLYKLYAFIRHKLQLPYLKVNKDSFFVDEKDNKPFMAIINELWRRDNVNGS